MSEPKKFSIPIKCGFCANETPMEIKAKYCKTIHVEYDYKLDMDFTYDEDYYIVECPACFQILFRRVKSCDYRDPDEWLYELLYPLPSKPIEGLPDSIQKALDKAMKVKAIDSDAFGVSIGRVLELICIEQKAKGNTLFNKLEFLANQGKIPKRLIDLAHGLRDLRNIGAHADLGELTSEEVPILEDISRIILEYIYVTPKLMEKVELRLNELRKSR